jgi:hypothetical protein
MTKDATPRKAVFYAFSTDGGQTFAPRIRLSGQEAGVAAHPQIARAGSAAAVVWDETSNTGRRIRLLVIGADGSTHLAPGARSSIVVEDQGAPVYPGVAAAKGAFVVAWTASVPEQSTIAVRRVSR